MARPTERVLALLGILQSGGTHSATELAVRLDIDERTVRRYVDHLLDLDVPVRAERGRNGGYRVAPGERMPPLMLTAEEALAVMVGLVAGPRERAASPSADAAAAKVRRVLPEALGRRLKEVLATSGVEAPVPPVAPPANAVPPRPIEAPGGVDRSDRTLTAPAAPAPGRHEVSLLVQGPLGLVRARMPAAVATVNEVATVPTATTRAGTASGWVRVRMRVDRLDWIPAVLASLGRPIVIEHPDSLRAEVSALARRLAAHADLLNADRHLGT